MSLPLPPITTGQCISPSALTQKINGNFDQYFDISQQMSTSQASSVVQTSVNDLASKLELLATSEVGGYINGTADTTNFSEDAVFASIQKKTAAVFDTYMSNIGNQISMTGTEQITVLAASYNASQLVNTTDFRTALSTATQHQHRL